MAASPAPPSRPSSVMPNSGRSRASPTLPVRSRHGSGAVALKLPPLEVTGHEIDGKPEHTIGRSQQEGWFAALLLGIPVPGLSASMGIPVPHLGAAVMPCAAAGAWSMGADCGRISSCPGEERRWRARPAGDCSPVPKPPKRNAPAGSVCAEKWAAGWPCTGDDRAEACITKGPISAGGTGLAFLLAFLLVGCRRPRFEATLNVGAHRARASRFWRNRSLAHPVGKGLNQAVAAQRSGAKVVFVSAIGGDAAGIEIENALLREAFDDLRLIKLSCDTDVSILTVTADGENSIITTIGCTQASSAERLTAFSIRRSSGRLRADARQPVSCQHQRGRRSGLARAARKS